MEIDPYSLVSALNAVLAQRLIRLVCSDCAKPNPPTAAELAASGLSADAVKDYHFVHGHGCGRCRGTGYRGRTAIAELLHLDDEIRQMIIERQPVARIKAVACSRGLVLLRGSALALVRDGRTTLEEINRVTFVG
ncbi:Type II secretion system protein E [compost metagenome]